MSNMKRSMRRVFWLLALCFFLLLGYLGKLVFVDREEISGNSYNSRLRYVDETIKRGDILDREGEVIATSTRQEDGIYKREYPRGRMAAHITGYSSVGKTGVEAAENFELMKLHNELFQRVSSVVRKTELQGNSVALTMDMDIQTTAGNLLGSAKGAIVVMEPSTGRILALQAYPDFDPNTVEAQWDTLKEDADSPLVNRATQGLYPPGSTFKTVTALAGMEYLSDWQSFQVECTGERVFQDKVIHCYNNKVHGMVDMKSALAYSCNCYFAALADEIGAGKLAKTMRQVGMDADSRFELETSRNSIYLAKGATESELVETAIGQGRTGVTPLYMAMLASAFANDGMMMKPYIVDHVVYPDGTETKNTVPEKLTEICTAEEAAAIRDMMIGVVSGGTGTAAAINGVTVAGKTGTAENATGYDHSWFIGFAPAENPKVAVAVVIENANYGSATPIAGKVMQAALAELEKLDPQDASGILAKLHRDDLLHAQKLEWADTFRKKNIHILADQNPDEALSIMDSYLKKNGLLPEVKQAVLMQKVYLLMQQNRVNELEQPLKEGVALLPKSFEGKAFSKLLDKLPEIKKERGLLKPGEEPPLPPGAIRATKMIVPTAPAK